MSLSYQTPAVDEDHLPIGILREVGPTLDLRSVAFPTYRTLSSALLKGTPQAPSGGPTFLGLRPFSDEATAAGFDLHFAGRDSVTNQRQLEILTFLSGFGRDLEESWDVPREISLAGLAEHLGVVRSRCILH